MLNKSYDHILLGMNYISLTYGILNLQASQSVLMANNEDISLTGNWLLNIGELEKEVLRKIGHDQKIDALQSLDDFITPTNDLIYFNEVCIEFSQSPFLNIKEMMRKFPKTFLETFSTLLESCTENEFNEQFFKFIEDLSIQKDKNNATEIFKLVQYPLIKKVLLSFSEFIEKEPEFSKQINHVLQVTYQVSFSSEISTIDSQYLFISLLSPRYIINDEKLKAELLFIYRKLGGDIKNTSIKDWGFVDGHLKHIMLNSVDGATELGKASLFAPPYEGSPFDGPQVTSTYHSIDFRCAIENEFIDFYKNKRIIFSKNDRMGSDFPFWEFWINEEHILEGTYAYMDGQGVKPSFYFHQAVEDIYQSLKELLPGLLKVDWVTRVSLRTGEDIWQEFSNLKEGAFSKSNINKYLYHKTSGKRVEDIYQLGPNNSGTMGLYAHLLEILQV